MGFWAEVKKQFLKDLEQAGYKSIILKYLGGFNSLKVGKSVTIKQTGKPHYIKVNNKEVKAVGLEWQKDSKRSLGKGVAGAIIGGALTGGIGALAGGAIGARRKDDSTAILTVMIEGQEEYLLLECNQKQFKQLSEII